MLMDFKTNTKKGMKISIKQIYLDIFEKGI